MMLMQQLPEYIELQASELMLAALQPEDWHVYARVYGDERLMQFIGTVPSPPKLQADFQRLLTTHQSQQPAYRTYKVQNQQQNLGLLGLQWIDTEVLQFGVILLPEFQQLGWSKKIKAAVMAYISNALEVKTLRADCRRDNRAANHVNQSLNMTLVKKYYHHKKGHWFNQWELPMINHKLKQKHNHQEST